MLNRIKALADDLFPEVVRLRRKLHQHPELAFEEVETARTVIETLAPLGFSMQTEVAKTGVIATLQGGQPGPTLLLRADMDALPIHEENDFPYRSDFPGKMHACGHDAHTSSLLGTALILHQLKEEVRGNIRFLFQPSEEKIPGGALDMIEAGALAAHTQSPAPVVAFGQHVRPELPVGKIGVRKGMFMASADEIYLTVRGEGGHAAEPHRLRADAIVVAAHIIVALQTIISRNCPPDVPSVLSFGRILGEGATNIIPFTARLEGTLRSMDETWRLRAHNLICRVAEHTARAHGSEVDIEIRKGYPALYNHEAPSDLVREAAQDYVGAEQTVDLDYWFASEDFAYYLQDVPGCFYLLGVGNAGAGIAHGLHTPRFTVDEEALRIGPGFMAYLAYRSGMATIPQS